jgi:broad specificity phosphatase PhoE
MVIITVHLVRHSYRDPYDYSYESELIPQGHQKAKIEVKNELIRNEPIHSIYSSVYPRAIQTVLPYVKYIKGKINIDGGLHERISDINTKYTSSKRALERYSEYVESISDSALSKVESDMDVINRVRHFLNSRDLDYSIICSHQGVLSAFISLSLSDTYDGNMSMAEVKTVQFNLDYPRTDEEVLYRFYELEGYD